MRQLTCKVSTVKLSKQGTRYLAEVKSMLFNKIAGTNRA